MNHEPVVARPASTGYRLQKYVLRHRVGVAIAAAMVLLLAGFAVLQAAQLRRITRERDRANRITDFMSGMFKVSDPSKARGNSTRVHEDNHTFIVNGRLYMDHDEETLDTIDHECDLEAYCGGCEKLLPWALYQIRELDGVTLAEAPAAIAQLLAELEGDPQIASA